MSGQFHDLVCLAPGETGPITLWIGGWVGPIVGLDAAGKRIIPTIVPAGNRTPVIQAVA
jgi:hypothetical protein